MRDNINISENALWDSYEKKLKKGHKNVSVKVINEALCELRKSQKEIARGRGRTLRSFKDLH